MSGVEWRGEKRPHALRAVCVSEVMVPPRLPCVFSRPMRRRRAKDREGDCAKERGFRKNGAPRASQPGRGCARRPPPGPTSLHPPPTPAETAQTARRTPSVTNLQHCLLHDPTWVVPNPEREPREAQQCVTKKKRASPRCTTNSLAQSPPARSSERDTAPAKRAAMSADISGPGRGPPWRNSCDQSGPAGPIMGGGRPLRKGNRRNARRLELGLVSGARWVGSGCRRRGEVCDLGGGTSG